MNNLNQIEIQNIRHICGHATGFCDKIAYYKTICQDTEETECLTKICESLTGLKNELSNML